MQIKMSTNNPSLLNLLESSVKPSLGCYSCSTGLVWH